MAVMRMPGRPRTSATVATAALLALGLGATVSGEARADEAVGVIADAGAEGAIAGSYIVILEDSAFSANSERGEALADRHDAKVTSVYEHALNGFAARMTESEALELAADPAVAQVVQNQTVSINDTQTDPPSWGLDRIDQADPPLDDSYTYPSHAGAGVTAYIVDTGVRLSHEDFGGRATFGFDAFGGNGSDGNGHGTHVAGTVAGASYGVAKAADIVAVKVLDNAGSGTIETVVAGVDFVTGDADGPAVANMSLGGGASAALDTAVRNSIAAGVTYAVAAGNDYGDDASASSPARVDEAITVASSTNTDAISGFSNVGSVVDIFGPGSGITSAWSTGDSAENTISGTSMATPHVAGAAALYLADNPAATPAQVEAALVDSAVWNRLSGVPSNTPNALLHIGGEGGAPEPPDGPRFENVTNVDISDLTTSESEIDVTGAGVLDGAYQVEVDIVHTWIGDLTIELIAPNGTVRVLHDQSGGSTDNLNAVYTLNGTGLSADGTWTLRVTDNANADEGHLNGWALQF
ncbi:S8 family peptidase [Streptomyces litchfieldiae]|uniref:S8 family peptidase n=1 Tax=Streptomyces litchfieldiae TaxID=3075543 RepID=A0ABU2MLI6_9ACTN|nr:S8 family peptidase [Streptomyces sp. DSM 44938]MDT0342472.1 S8 family peptidase [Streptomyces sp. DSM 44938]